MKNTRTIKTALLVSGLILFGGITATAQDDTKLQNTSRAWVTMNVAKLNLQLGLNDVQQASLKEINERYMAKHHAFESATPTPTDTQMEDKVSKLMTERDRDMEAMLTAEQYSKWIDMRQKGTSELRDEQQEKKEHHKEHHKEMKK